MHIIHITYSFGSLQLHQNKDKFHLQCKANIVKMIHNDIQNIDPDYDESNQAASQLPKITILAKFIYDHDTSTPYSFSIQKYGKQSCTYFKPIRAPVGAIPDLFLQRQPTPIHYKNLTGHFLSQKEVLVIFNEKTSTNIPTDLSCLY